MLEVFTTNKYDNQICIVDGNNFYSYLDLKKLISSEIDFIKDKKENVVILGDNNFSFVIQFFAALFCQKKIYLLTDKAKLNFLDIEYDILKGYSLEDAKEFDFKNIDIKKPLINFYTSGSTGIPKSINTSLYNLILEAEDISKIIKFDNNSTVMATTNLCHRYGLVTHLLLSITQNLIFNAKSVCYPTHIDKENSVLVTTPTFLSSVTKYNNQFKIMPKYIFSAGSKLNEDIFKYFENITNIVEIYGSTETGDIAYKIHYNDDLTLFNNIKLIEHNENTEVYSKYFDEKKVVINDKVEVFNNHIKIKNRTDRLYKIYEKRICADELEEKLKSNDFVANCYIIKHNDKLACLCALSETGKKYLLRNNIPILIKNLKQYLLNFSEIIPQKWKFIDQLPMTKVGKIDKTLIEHLFNMNLSLPVILNRKLNENSITYKIFFYRQCNFFNGHFPEFKLTAGVVQLYLAKKFANVHFVLDLGQGQWKRIKFSNIIKSDSIINLQIEKTEKYISYKYFDDNKTYASGVFLCENIFKEIL